MFPRGIFSKPTLLAMHIDVRNSLNFIKDWKGCDKERTEFIEVRNHIEADLYNLFNLELGEDGYFHTVKKED